MRIEFLIVRFQSVRFSSSSLEFVAGTVIENCQLRFGLSMGDALLGSPVSLLGPCRLTTFHGKHFRK